MSFRRSAALALAAAALVSGCAKNVDKQPPPNEIVVAAFNSPACSDLNPLLCSPTAIPTPNDLALQATPTLPASAQKALLQAFVNAGGFPSDQAVGITIPFKRMTFNAATTKYDLSSYAQTPRVDTTTIHTTSTAGAPQNVVVLKVDVTPPVEQTVEVDAANCTTGQIVLMKAKSASGSRAWAPGRYVFAMRAGAVKTTTGLFIDADQAVALVAPNKDLSNPNNQPPGGLPPALVAKVEPVRAVLWQPVDWGNVGGLWTVNGVGSHGAFPAVAPYFPPDQVAVIGTFEIAPAAPTPPVDSGSGIAPLPLDLLRTANSGTTIAFNAAFGPAAQGLTTLDGFSTTAMVFAPVTVPVDAATVNGATVHLFKLKGGAVTLQKEFRQELGKVAAGDPLADPYGSTYVAEPTPITTTTGKFLAPGVPCAAATCSLLVGLQPAAGADVPLPLQGALGTNKIYLPPLDEATDYAVVITTAVKDMLGRPLVKSTVAKILTDPGFDPVATSSVNGKSGLRSSGGTVAAAGVCPPPVNRARRLLSAS
jgi:hypothetical protein